MLVYWERTIVTNAWITTRDWAVFDRFKEMLGMLMMHIWYPAITQSVSILQMLRESNAKLHDNCG